MFFLRSLLDLCNLYGWPNLGKESGGGAAMADVEFDRRSGPLP